MSDSQRKTLPIHEWAAILLIVTLLAILTVLALGKDQATLPKHLNAPHFITTNEIEVWIEGAVENPGYYKVKRGTCIKGVLELATCKQEADLRKVKLQKKLRNGQIIKIPQKEMITIFVEGEVEHPKTISLQKGSQVKELIPMLIFTSKANVEKLNRKRKLKDGEKIVVPSL